MLTLVLLCAVITSHAAKAWGTTEWGITASPSCRYNCGSHFGYCDCASSCEYWGSCCWDYHTYCSATPGPMTTEDAMEPTTSPSCYGNCDRDLGSCSCSYSCYQRGDCCPDYSWYCSYYTDQTTMEPTSAGTEEPSCRYNCWSHMGSCSCSSSCEYRGNCCKDYYYYCGSRTMPDTTTIPTTADGDTGVTHDISCRFNCGRELLGCSCRSSCQYRGDCCFDYYWECPSDTTTYDATTPEPSCRYNCDRHLGSCSCRSSCQYYGNCCHDFYWHCPSYTQPHWETTPEPGTPEPTTRPSCWGNCGRHLGSCSCTSSCPYRGDCCSDFSWYCNFYTTPYPTPDSTNGPSCWGNCGRHLGSCSCTSSCPYRGDCCSDFSWYCNFYTTPYPTPDSTNGGSCGGFLSGSGSFSSPNYPGYYHDHANCNWQIQTSSGQTIYLRFTHVQLENCCNCDYILVYDGPSVYSRLLGKVCNENFNNNGSISVSDFHSSSNYLTVVFRSDSSVVGRGFNAEFTSSLSSNSGRVTCSSDNMNIVVSKRYLTSVGINPNNLYLNDEYCRPDYSYYNVIFNFPINSCGTVRKVDDGRIVYTNALRAFPSTHGEITRQYLYRLNVSCRMEEDSVSQIIYEVKHSDQVSISGSGRYNTSMAFYTSSGFYYKVTQDPYLVNLNQYMYVQVSLGSRDTSLVLFLDTCVATPSLHGFHNRSHYLIRNGCRTDSTFYTYSSGTASYARFRFQAFQFLRATERVYIQCKVLICPRSDYNSRCRRGCLRRKARDLGSEHQVETVVLGPIQLQEEDNGAEEAEQETEG